MENWYRWPLKCSVSESPALCVYLCDGHLTPAREVRPVPCSPECVCVYVKVCLCESSGRWDPVPEDLRMMGLFCYWNRRYLWACVCVYEMLHISPGCRWCNDAALQSNTLTVHTDCPNNPYCSHHVSKWPGCVCAWLSVSAGKESREEKLDKSEPFVIGVIVTHHQFSMQIPAILLHPTQHIVYICMCVILCHTYVSM